MTVQLSLRRLDAAAPGFDQRAGEAHVVRVGTGCRGRRDGRRDHRRRPRSRRRGAHRVHGAIRRRARDVDGRARDHRCGHAARVRIVARGRARGIADCGGAHPRLPRAADARVVVVSRRRRQRIRPAGDPARQRRRLRARRQGRVSVVGADERDSGARRGGRGDRHGRARARRRSQSAGAGRRASRGRVARVHDRRRAGDRGARLRYRDASRRSTRSAARATPTSPPRSVASSARSASTWSRAPRRSSSSPTPRPTRTGSRWTSSPRPSTTSSRRRSSSRPTRRCSTPSRRAHSDRSPACPGPTIIAAAFAHRGALVKVRDLDAACAIANRIAPEHLELAVADPAALLPKIRHAGAIFMGHRIVGGARRLLRRPEPRAADRAAPRAFRRRSASTISRSARACSTSRRERRARSVPSRRRSRAAKAWPRMREARSIECRNDGARARRSRRRPACGPRSGADRVRGRPTPRA